MKIFLVKKLKKTWKNEGKNYIQILQKMKAGVPNVTKLVKLTLPFVKYVFIYVLV